MATFDTIISGGRIIDGTGSPAFFADVGITDGRIATIGELSHASAETVIDALRLGLDPGTPGILRDFEKRRRPDIASRVAGVDFMNRIVSNDRMPLRDLRRVGLKIISGITPLRLQAMRHGLAPSMDAGRLSRGLPL